MPRKTSVSRQPEDKDKVINNEPEARVAAAGTSSKKTRTTKTSIDKKPTTTKPSVNKTDVNEEVKKTTTKKTTKKVTQHPEGAGTQEKDINNKPVPDATKKKPKKQNLYYVYWNYDKRKCIISGKDEEEAKEQAKRFAGKYATFSKVEFLMEL